MSSGCGDVLSLADLQTAKKHQIFEAEVITGKSGGVAGGADIDYATNQVTGQTQKTLPAVLRDLGFEPASFDFTTGGTLTINDRNKVVYDPVSRTWYSYAGALPVVVPASFNPVGNADWKPQTDPFLRDDLASTSGAGMVGYQPVGTGAVATNVQSKLRETVSVKDFGAVLSAAVASADTAGGRTVYVPFGAYTVDADLIVPSTVTLRFHGGAMVTVAAGVTLDIRGEIEAPSTEIFDGQGTVILDGSPSGYNLSWFKTANGYINERFDFAKRGMTSFNNKVIRIPAPRRGAAGTLTSGSRTFWLFNAPLKFTDKQNTSKIYVEGEFYAAGDCAAFMEFNDAAKPESIFFYGSVQAQASPAQVIPVGIDVKSGERIQFFCNVVLNGFRTPVRLGSPDMVAAANTCYFPQLTVSFFYENAVLIYGASSTLTSQGHRIGNLNAIAAQSAGLSAVKIVGLVRNLEIDNIVYATDVAKNGYAAFDAENVVEIDGAVSNVLMSHVKIGRIYQSIANVALKIKSSLSSAALIRDIEVGEIFGKFGGTAADVDYCQLVSIGNIENSANVTIGANAAYTRIDTNAGVGTITDSGTNTIVNGLGKQSRGGGVPPAPSIRWPIGTLIRETSDNRVYLRIAQTGASSDFMMVRGALRGTMANRPTLAATDVGQLYMDNTLNSNGKPIWWNGTAWVDANGAVV